MKTRYVVQDNHTLGYIYEEEQPHIFHFLHCSVLRGSPYDRWSGFTVITEGMTLRDATLEDFDAFRVNPPPSMREAN